MWGKPPFYISDNYAIDVRNLGPAREWYKEKLGLREAQTDRTEDSGRSFVDLRISSGEPLLSLVEFESGAVAKSGHVIFFARNLEKAHSWLGERGVAVEPVSTDSGGNRYFRFQDLEGNRIEVCVEPG
jgi:catechol 2,3-dioxygenase-like lactoylglutathione lyase family enzyme